MPSDARSYSHIRGGGRSLFVHVFTILLECSRDVANHHVYTRCLAHKLPNFGSSFYLHRGWKRGCTVFYKKFDNLNLVAYLHLPHCVFYNPHCHTLNIREYSLSTSDHPCRNSTLYISRHSSRLNFDASRLPELSL